MGSRGVFERPNYKLKKGRIGEINKWLQEDLRTADSKQSLEVWSVRQIIAHPDGDVVVLYS